MPLHVERRDRVALLTLDEPDRRNALTPPLVEEIVATMDGIELDDEVGAVVVTGAPPAFCSGADVGQLGLLQHGAEAPGVRNIYEGFLRVFHCSVPTVAAVNGPAVGAGFNLALTCDVRLASSAARFDARFVQIGVHPGGGHTWLLERAVGPQAAAAIVLFGERVDAERAAAIGLAWRVVPEDELLDAAMALAARAADVPRALAVRTKATLRQVPWHAEFEGAVRTELDAQVWSFEQGFLKQR